METPSDNRIAIVTPSFARDFEVCRALNASVLEFVPEGAKHYILVDRCDLETFRPLNGGRTTVAAIEDVIPPGYHKIPLSKKWWFSRTAGFPAKGWLVQQLVKLSAARVLEEPVLVFMDSDVRFVRPVNPATFSRDGATRLYRKPGGITAGMHHVRWHEKVCELLGVPADSVPMDDYVDNVISWDRKIALAACDRIETVTGQRWDIAMTRARLVSEYLLYGLFVNKVLGLEKAPVWIDERSWCHTYWGPAPLAASEVERFVAAMPSDDVAVSIAGYTATDPQVQRAAWRLIAPAAAMFDLA